MSDEINHLPFQERVEHINGLMADGGDELDHPIENDEMNTGLTFGERIRIIAGDNSNGPYTGDVGYVILETVGSAERGNQRIVATILVDDTESTYDLDGDVEWESA